MSLHRNRVVAVVAGAVTVVALGASGSVASSMLGSRQIADNSIRSRDVMDGTLRLKDLRSYLQDRITRPDGGPAMVGRLRGAFAVSNNSVSLTDDGVEFGPYADGGAAGGSLVFNGFNGHRLLEIRSLTYNARYTAKGDTGGVGVPYLRVFLADGTDVIFSPNTQLPDADDAEGPFHEWVATSGSWRVNDDIGNNPDVPFAAVVQANGAKKITGIKISAGFTAGEDLTVLLRSLELNGKQFEFRG